MSATTRLVVLGAVRRYQPAHGYQIRQGLLSWRMDEWANVAPGSVYHALKSMARTGLLRVVEDERDAGNVARTVYEMTDAGEAEYRNLLRGAWLGHNRTYDSLMAATALLPDVPRAELIPLLKQRIVQLEADALLTESGKETVRAMGHTPPHVSELFDLTGGLAAAELVWVRNLLAKVEAGAYQGWSTV
ncbi:PadR family transcriptional regulator [Allokutzneria sp. A3M-2-11 16]|uniref:PadR family transcriptional regulator n=1 Tax=Allokutzneria sp. A3M-2-11 16 TaxID=2962043 RepID=UPI0020B7EA2A|nr:PadR family transcriptional regulator [Allokutzneria sp. A3M-2-11 16]MCP3798763.1 PadR family transcriptional regulator [Allokutzneria sp. A3M-2-11 16]